MQRKHHGQHDDCNPCKWLSITVSDSATPTRSKPKPRSQRERDRKDNSNAWERGIATDVMPDGTRVPFIDEKGQPIGLKKMVNEPKYRKERERLQQERASKG